MSDPNAVTEAFDAAIDAFNEERQGMPTREPNIEMGADWKAQQQGRGNPSLAEWFIKA